MEPSEVKEFWEEYGFLLEFDDAHYYCYGHWRNPKGDYIIELPPIDLNNLFLYAVPKAIDKIMAERECSSDVAYAILFKKWLSNLELDMTHPADSLFRALQEVKNG